MNSRILYTRNILYNLKTNSSSPCITVAHKINQRTFLSIVAKRISYRQHLRYCGIRYNFIFSFFFFLFLSLSPPWPCFRFDKQPCHKFPFKRGQISLGTRFVKSRGRTAVASRCIFSQGSATNCKQRNKSRERAVASKNSTRLGRE